MEHAVTAAIHNADCVEFMATMPDSCVDAVITDPPYGLEFMGAEWDAPWKIDPNVGKTWNTGMGKVEMADGYKRLQRPSYENTQNVRCRKCGKWKVSSNPCTCEKPDFPNIKLSNMRTFQQYMTPVFVEALRVSKPGAHLLCFGGTRTFHRMACAIEDAGWEIRDTIMWVYGSGFPKSMDVSKAIDRMKGATRRVVGMTRGDDKRGGNYHGASDRGVTIDIPVTESATDDAKQWEGWGTALKPAWEPIIVARKPLDGTVASNVLEHGTGAMNIDACRVPTDETWKHDATASRLSDNSYDLGRKRIVQCSNSAGRFPANLVHDGSDEVVALFPYSKGQQGDVTGDEPSRPTDGVCYGGGYNDRQAFAKRGDTGSAARFFYCAKASAEDRGDGNDHPTVKPRALMEWLVKLVTTRDATVLDPFCGSGSTLVAAAGLGRGCIGIERDPHYHEIAVERVRRAEDEFAGTLWSLGLEGV